MTCYQVLREETSINLTTLVNRSIECPCFIHCLHFQNESSLWCDITINIEICCITFFIDQLRIAHQPSRLVQARDPGVAAVQAERAGRSDQPEHGQRLGHPALHRGQVLPAQGRQISHPQGP